MSRSRNFATHLELIDSRTIPHEYKKGPDLSYYTETAEFYYNLAVDASRWFKKSFKHATREEIDTGSSIAYNRLVNASWGMIACGAESLPYAVTLSRSSHWDLNEVASNVWCGLQDPDRVDSVLRWVYSHLDSSPSEPDLLALLEYLGYLRNKSAIAVLSPYLLDNSRTEAVRLTAAISLGRIARKRFERAATSSEAIQAAAAWLASKAPSHRQRKRRS